jgi:alkylation response protein AidB-like acyl-CoA dehydrogenase
MDFRLTDDQVALQGGIRAWCDGNVPIEKIAEIAAAGGRLDRALWSGLAEMGVFGLRAPERDGGVGLGLAEAVLVFAELVPGAVTGDTIVGGIDLAGALAEPIVIEHLDALDALLVVRADSVERLDPKAVKAEAIATPLDPATPIAHARELPKGERIAGADVAARLRLEGAALTAALSLGIAEMTQELAVAYAKQREQFGRAIASFQTIKHMCSDMWVRQEMARAAVWAAGATYDQEGVGDPERAISSARVVAGDTAMKNARACIQIYGGMGYTWEMPPHYYLKRAWVLSTWFGTGEEHEERLAETLAATT